MDEDLKETYRMWWEFTRRNKHLKSNHDMLKSFSHDVLHGYMLKGYDMFLQQGKDDQLKAVNSSLRICTYFRFRIFFEGDFEDFWQSQNNITRNACTGGLFKFEEVQNDMENAIEVYRVAFGKEPTLTEFIHFFPRLITADIFEIYVKIRPYGVPFEVICTELKNILHDAVKSKKSPQSLWHQYSGPTTPVDVGKMELYLKVYDMFAMDMPAEEIAMMIYPGIDKNVTDDYDSKIRNIYKYYEKARRIIKNTAGGIFPGRYKTN